MPIRFLAIGTIEPRKNYSASIEIIRALNDAGVPAELHIVGRIGWGQRPFLTNPPPFLKLHGYVGDKELERVMKDCHFLLSTSNAEGLGLPLLEVQHGGLPVVAPKGEVFEEVLGESALFIDPSDTVGAAQMILGLARDPKRLALAANASRTNVVRWNKLAAGDFERFHQFLLKGIAAFPAEPAHRNLSGPGSVAANSIARP
jgi:glycosyltransferase involved in cell wall biosynthesis